MHRDKLKWIEQKKTEQKYICRLYDTSSSMQRYQILKKAQTI